MENLGRSNTEKFQMAAVVLLIMLILLGSLYFAGII